ncbi:MAG: PIG-L family deacetylase [Gemmataceae bacterium]
MTLDYLVVAAHPDDAELCLGGTILALKARKATVGILDLTDGEPTPHGSPTIRDHETQAATKILGVDWRGTLGLTNRELINDLRSRRLLASKFRELRPRNLLAHYYDDAHPDHIAASQLTEASRFWSKLSQTNMPHDRYFPEKIFYFFSFHLRLHCQPSFVLDISDHHEMKMEAIQCYHSQFAAGRSTEFPTFFDDVIARDRYWGWTISKTYGEPLVTKELVGIRNLIDVC